MEAFVNEVIMAYGNWRFLMLTVALLVVGLVFLKDYKKRFVVPALILSAVILNPIFYTLWYKFNDRSYWRMMWMIPIIPVCVIVPAYFIEKCKKSIVKVGVLMLATVIMVLCGRFIYDRSREVFVAANNPEKLPDDVVAVGEALLELDEEPYIATDASLSVYLRQYSGKIKSVYGRDFKWQNSNPNLADRIFTNLTSEDGDFGVIAQDMLNYDYKYLVTRIDNEERNRKINDTGFELVRTINDYGIYQVVGKKTEVRTYNGLHQVTSVSYVDEQGNLKNIEEGYARIEYIYLDKDKDPLLYFYDEDSIKLEMGSGYFHDFLNNIESEGIILFIAARDEASKGMTDVIVEDMKALGLKTDLRDKYRQSYLAVISSENVVEEISEDALSYDAETEDVMYSLSSAAKFVGDYSSIKINGHEYSTNSRGLNIVVYDINAGKVVDALGIDTFSWNMPVNRQTVED